MKRLTLALCIIITMALTVTAQGVDGIKRNSSYLYGEGGGVTLQAAKEAALADLIQKIGGYYTAGIRGEVIVHSVGGTWSV